SSRRRFFTVACWLGNVRLDQPGGEQLAALALLRARLLGGRTGRSGDYGHAGFACRVFSKAGGVEQIFHRFAVGRQSGNAAAEEHIGGNACLLESGSGDIANHRLGEKESLINFGVRQKKSEIK